MFAAIAAKLKLKGLSTLLCAEAEKFGNNLHFERIFKSVYYTGKINTKKIRDLHRNYCTKVRYEFFFFVKRIIKFKIHLITRGQTR